MKKTALALFNILYLAYLIVISLLYEAVFFGVYLPFFLALKKGRLDDAFRIHNWAYGQFTVRASWPYIRASVRGAENIPARGPYVIVLNHRSSLDIFFSSLVPVPNQLVIVRSWVFRLKIFGWAMRLAHYLNIDKTCVDEFRQVGREYSARQVSFQFYPEGHRSRDGRLLRFRTGAFYIAAENNLPVVPVFMIGTNDFARFSFPYLHPAKVQITILPAVFPKAFDEDLRALKMRRYVEKIFREYSKS